MTDAQNLDAQTLFAGIVKRTIPERDFYAAIHELGNVQGGIQKAVELALPFAKVRADELAGWASQGAKAVGGANSEIFNYEQYKPRDPRLEQFLSAIPDTINPSDSKLPLLIAKWLVGRTLEKGNMATRDIVNAIIDEARRNAQSSQISSKPVTSQPGLNEPL